MSAIALGKKEEPYSLHDGYLLYGNRLCVTQPLREKVMNESHAPPYAGHRGIQTTFKAIEMYYYWPRGHTYKIMLPNALFPKRQSMREGSILVCFSHYLSAITYYSRFPMGEYIHEFHLWITQVYSWEYGNMDNRRQV